MKHKIHEKEPIMEEYDDNNIQHVLAGPEYGQPWADSWIDWKEDYYPFDLDDELIEECLCGW